MVICSPTPTVLTGIAIQKGKNTPEGIFRCVFASCIIVPAAGRTGALRASRAAAGAILPGADAAAHSKADEKNDDDHDDDGEEDVDGVGSAYPSEYQIDDGRNHQDVDDVDPRKMQELQHLLAVYDTKIDENLGNQVFVN